VAQASFKKQQTTHPADPGWSRSSAMSGIRNAGGVAGAWFADVALYLLGYLAYLIPVLIGYSGWLLFSRRGDESGLHPSPGRPASACWGSCSP